MTRRIPAANKVAVLFAAVAIGGFTASQASAQTPTPAQKKEAKRQYDSHGRIVYGNGFGRRCFWSKRTSARLREWNGIPSMPMRLHEAIS